MVVLKTIWGKNKEDIKLQALTDDIIGGNSKSKIFISDDKEIIFNGEVSTKLGEKSYAAFKTPIISIEDSNEYNGVCIKIMGDGKKYRLVIRTTFKEDSIYFHRIFMTKPHEWQTHYIAFDEFKAYYKYIRIPALKINKTKMKSMGIMISDDQHGHFHLAVSDIAFYKGKVEHIISRKLLK